MAIDLAIPVPNISQPASTEAIDTIARVCDRVGLHSVWLGDHVVWPTRPEEQRPGESPGDAKYGGALFEPLVTGGYVAGITENVRIGFGILIAPYRHPVVAAKMIATLDQLSGGRLIVGVGGGYVAGEFRALDIPMRRLGAQVEDLIGLLRAVEASPEPDFQGELVALRDARFLPQPLQRPLPIWVGGMAEPALRRAVVMGDGWHGAGLGLDDVRPLVDRLRDLADEAGRDLATLTISNRLRVRFAPRPVPYRPSSTPGPYETLPVHVEGPSEHVAAELLRFRALGVSHLVLDLHEGEPLEVIVEAIERLGADVISVLHSA
jgi:probable F420-dependent oxidoreductase